MSKFNAKDAREEVVDYILTHIKAKASSGECVYKHFDHLSEECIKAIQKLGFEVRECEPLVLEEQVGDTVIKTDVFKDVYQITW